MSNDTNKQNCSQHNSKKSDFLDHIKKVSDQVDQWPEWKKGEYVNVYEQYNDIECKKTDNR